ncbi:MAG: hypothetical protein ABSC48_17790 [Terracidiphilus sp.]|jgi:hypothetical protein
MRQKIWQIEQLQENSSLLSGEFFPLLISYHYPTDLKSVHTQKKITTVISTRALFAANIPGQSRRLPIALFVWAGVLSGRRDPVTSESGVEASDSGR